MKLKNTIMLCLTAMLGTTTCDPNMVTPRDIAPEYHVTVIKFHEPEYKEYIMTVYAGGGSTGMSMEYLIVPDSVIHLCGTSPYIELPDNYLMTDWKWGRVYYQNNEAIINHKWNELESIYTQWDESELYVRYPVAKAYAIPLSFLREYNNGVKYDIDVDTCYDCKRWSYLRTGDYSEMEWSILTPERRTEILQHVNYGDTVQGEYVEILTRVIEEGNLPDKHRIRLRNNHPVKK